MLFRSLDAIMAVTRLAGMLGDRLTSLDVNPIIVGPRGRGAFAVDLLVAGQGDGR